MDNAGQNRKIDTIIIARVKQLREEKGISQEELANHLGVTSSYIAHIESPKYRARYNLYHVLAIIRLMECAPEEILPLQPL